MTTDEREAALAIAAVILDDEVDDISDEDRTLARAVVDLAAADDGADARLAAFVRPTGDRVPTCCERCAYRYQLLTHLADHFAAGDWRIDGNRFGAADERRA